MKKNVEKKFLPALDISVNETTGRIRSAYLQVRKGMVSDTREISPGRAFADYDSQGLLLGIELLGPCEAKVLRRLSAEEPKPIKRFLLGSPPRELIPA
jgi:hypothetical protein